MGSLSAATTTVQDTFTALKKQQDLINTCTQLWQDLSDHFTSLQNHLDTKSTHLTSKRHSLDLNTHHSLSTLTTREHSLNTSVQTAISKVDEIIRNRSPGTESKLERLCRNMDSTAFLKYVISKRKEIEILRKEIVVALCLCIDPARFVLDAIGDVSFPDLSWACVVILESLVPALADPGEMGTERLMVTREMRERAKGVAGRWKEGLDGGGGVKPSDVHAYLQHVVTFGIGVKEEREFYRKLVVGIAWRRQMPKIALALGLKDRMPDMIEELIGKGQQLDAINFVYEAGLQDEFPPVPLLKSFLENSEKTASVSDDRSNSGQVVNNYSRKEQSALKAAIKCIEDHKLEDEFPLQTLQKRLENLEKVKVEKKKPSAAVAAVGPANKRTRANNGGPMPPAKAGRLTNNAYVSSFPAAPTYIRSPSSHTTYSTTYSTAVPPYPYDRPAGHGLYGSRSPPAIRDPYAYPTEELTPLAVGVSYPSPPMHYPPYGGYGNGLAPAYQQAYYR